MIPAEGYSNMFRNGPKHGGPRRTEFEGGADPGSFPEMESRLFHGAKPLTGSAAK